jgi:transcriptional regulator with XRE-family HTH domain
MVGRSLRARLRALGSNLKRRRVDKGFSQERMAERAGLTDDRFLRRIERGEVNVRFGTLVKLAEALHLEPSILLRPGKTAGLGTERGKRQGRRTK